MGAGLQWRAGERQPIVIAVDPSMEGRAIARPNETNPTLWAAVMAHLQWRAGQLPGQTSRRWRSRSCWRTSFNGGPGNCPAKLDPDDALRLAHLVLQWRAGQLPGQTRLRGDAIRPRPRPFNGGPGNCPAKPLGHGTTLALGPRLQWRAGQLPGQTRWPRSRRSETSAFNGGPGNCPAKLAGPRPQTRPRRRPSMEGRAIARPNLHEDGSVLYPTIALQWRAGQLPGQTPGDA